MRSGVVQGGVPPGFLLKFPAPQDLIGSEENFAAFIEQNVTQVAMDAYRKKKNEDKKLEDP